MCVFKPTNKNTIASAAATSDIVEAPKTINLYIPWNYILLHRDDKSKAITLIPQTKNTEKRDNFWKNIENKNAHEISDDLRQYKPDETCVMNFVPPVTITEEKLNSMQQSIQHILRDQWRNLKQYHTSNHKFEEGQITTQLLKSLQTDMKNLYNALKSRGSHLLLLNTMHSLQRQLKMQLCTAKFETKLREDMQATLNLYMERGLDDEGVWKRLTLGLHLAVLHFWCTQNADLDLNNPGTSHITETEDSTPVDTKYPEIKWTEVRLKQFSAMTNVVFLEAPNTRTTKLDWKGVDGTDIKKIITKAMQMNIDDNDLCIQDFAPSNVDDTVWQQAEVTIQDLFYDMWQKFAYTLESLQEFESAPGKQDFTTFVTGVSKNIQILCEAMHVQNKQISFINTLNQLEADINAILKSETENRKAILGLHLFILYTWRNTTYYSEITHRALKKADVDK